MIRLRDLGVTPGNLPTGPLNALTDVPGVRVGHVTLISGEGPLQPGIGPVRTGVTAILPHGGNIFREKVAAAVHTINGFGKVVGFEQVRELGTVEAPILLTNTMNVGLVADAVGTYLMRDTPELGIQVSSGNRVVGETSDGFLNDLQGRHVREQHVWQAIETAAEGPVAEGNVGAGTGTVCFGFKGGIGTASRHVFDGQVTVGALVQANFGGRAQLLVMGAPIGKHFLDRLLPESAPEHPPANTPAHMSAQPPENAPGQGSIMIVLATDAPVSSHILERMAKRATFGLARTGSICEDVSGDFVIAFSTTMRSPQLHHAPSQPLKQAEGFQFSEDAWTLGALFAAVVEAVEEAILNALVAAETLVGRDGHIAYALPHEELRDLLTYYRRR
ncbi:MAG TPA: P1 family peptidase [Ktedonobacterales bacterium]|nr:P1 family peptidase [Ktedonobacterales bacterium]